VAASPDEGDITHPKVIEALINWFQKRGKEVVIVNFLFPGCYPEVGNTDLNTGKRD
jgi:uncharacterized protein (DUF362 family)